ncbi:hypothetical protein TRIP_B250190 [uncultured Desulfatiglans sp.]|nr:hypothetical protein TRIP_B250190 [uncultured Desulfatiglans sp.]
MEYQPFTVAQSLPAVGQVKQALGDPTAAGRPEMTLRVTVSPSAGFVKEVLHKKFTEFEPGVWLISVEGRRFSDRGWTILSAAGPMPGLHPERDFLDDSCVYLHSCLGSGLQIAVARRSAND